jgi:putative transposase
MTRLPRDLGTSQWFHLVQRGADRQDIFTTDRDRCLYEMLVGESFGRWGVEAHAYALMTNHTHMLARVTDGGSLSGAMHHLGSRYALAFNKLTGRDGPLFTSRFHSTPVTSDAQLAQTARYIHRNPLAFVPSGALASYRWSSLGPICGRRSFPEWLAEGVVSRRPADDAYLSYVLSPQPSDRFPMGAFRPLTKTSLEEILAAVAHVAGVPVQALCSPSRTLAEARTLAIMLAIEMRAAGVDETARRFRLADPRSVRRAARRGRASAAQSHRFVELRSRVLDRLDERVDRRSVA